MATIIEFELPADEFALHETITTCPNATFEIERVVATSSEQIMPYVWVQADDFDALEQAFESDPTVVATTHLSTADDDTERSYRMEWTGPIDMIVHLLTEQDGTITHADGRDGIWALRVLFPDRAALSRAHEFSKTNGFSLDVRAIYAMDDERRMQVGLTKPQTEALVTGYEHGYFEVPRGMTLSDLAAQEGVSHQSLSERLRRGMDTLIAQTLITGSEPEQEDEGQGSGGE